MTVQIHIDANSAEEAREEMRRLLGEPRKAAPAAPLSEIAQGIENPKAFRLENGSDFSDITPPADETPEGEDEKKPDAEPEGRRYGQASAGKTRRTKAEMEEDANLEAWAQEMDVDLGKAEIAGAPFASAMLASLRAEWEQRLDDEDFDASRAEGRATRDTPEDRQDPNAVEDVEPAEEKAPAAEPKTRGDVIKAMQAYVAKVGPEEAEKTLPDVMGYAKQSAIPEDPAEFAKVVARIEEKL